MELNKEAVDALNNFIVKLVAGLEQGVNLTSEQIPLILNELLIWKTVSLSLWVFLGTVLLLLVCKSTKAIINPPSKERMPWIYEDHLGVKAEYFILQSMFSVVGGIVGVLLLSINTGDLLQVIFAPRVFLLEYATNLVK